MPDQYYFSYPCSNHWVSKKDKARCSIVGCFKTNTGIDVKIIDEYLSNDKDN